MYALLTHPEHHPALWVCAGSASPSPMRCAGIASRKNQDLIKTELLQARVGKPHAMRHVSHRITL